MLSCQYFEFSLNIGCVTLWSLNNFSYFPLYLFCYFYTSIFFISVSHLCCQSKLLIYGWITFSAESTSQVNCLSIDRNKRHIFWQSTIFHLSHIPIILCFQPLKRVDLLPSSSQRALCITAVLSEVCIDWLCNTLTFT